MASLVQIPIAPDALTDDPNLANYKTFDLIATVSGGEHWLACDLRFPLTAGTFYIPPHDDSDIVSPIRFDAGTRFLQNDTFVDVPIFNPRSTFIIGKSIYSPASQIGVVFPRNGSNFPDEPANDMKLVDAAWGFPNYNSTISDGVFTVARLTMTNDAFGSMRGRFLVNEHVNSPVSFVLATPEPTSTVIVCAGLGALALRRAPKH
jgi:hypothetical protein